jgi:hypothetical protein
LFDSDEENTTGHPRGDDGGGEGSGRELFIAYGVLFERLTLASVAETYDDVEKKENYKDENVYSDE